jgi:hypothetical protein
MKFISRPGAMVDADPAMAGVGDGEDPAMAGVGDGEGASVVVHIVVLGLVVEVRGEYRCARDRVLARLDFFQNAVLVRLDWFPKC